VLYGVVQVASGTAPPDPLLDSMAAAESTRYLLIAGGSVSREVAFNEIFARAAGERAQLWVAPDAGHTGAFGRHTGKYEERVIAFFDAALASGEDA